MLKALVFDLDDTLLDTSELLIPIAESSRFLERLSHPLPLMPGALENLKYLKARYQLFLLTFGRPDIQQKKVEALQIAKFFEGIYLCNSGDHETKREYFKKIGERYSQNSQVLSIGNRLWTDIRLAKLQGLQTCLFNYGEHQSEMPSQPEDHPDFVVQNHFELVRRCRL
jgi:putative hydrolase of the HAD superfamily